MSCISILLLFFVLLMIFFILSSIDSFVELMKYAVFLILLLSSAIAGILFYIMGLIFLFFLTNLFGNYIVIKEKLQNIFGYRKIR